MGLTAWTVEQDNVAAFGCINPQVLLEVAEELDYDTSSWYGKANSFTLGTGTTPGRGYVLIRKQDADKLDLNKFVTVRAIADADTVSLAKLLPVKCVAVYANSNEPTANVAYLLTLEDRRRLLRMTTIDGIFNVRTPEPTSTSGAGLYYAGSLNSGALWTWQTLLDHIWDENIAANFSAPYNVNASPTLPYTPEGTPENFRFHGVGALDAYDAVLDRVNCFLNYDIFSDQFTIVARAQVQNADFDDLEQNGKALATQCPASCIAAFMPEKVRVCFRTIEKWTGSGRDTNSGIGGGEFAPGDGPYWTAPSVYIDKPTSHADAIAGTKIILWDDLPAIMPDGFGASQASDASNFTELGTRATARAADYASGLDPSLDGNQYLRKLFTGYHSSVKTGSEITEIIWRDFGDDDIGPATEYRRYPKDNAIRVEDHLGVNFGPTVDLSSLFSRKSIGPPGIADSLLVRPRETQIVEITGAQSGAANGMYPGRVLRTNFRTSPGATDAIPYTTENNCWIININKTANAFGSVTFTTTAIASGERYLGRLVGWQTVSGTTRPVYVIETTEGQAKWVHFELVNPLTTSDATNTGATVVTYWGGGDPGANVDLINLPISTDYLFAGSVGARGYATYDEREGKYRIVQMECNT